MNIWIINWLCWHNLEMDSRFGHGLGMFATAYVFFFLFFHHIIFNKQIWRMESGKVLSRYTLQLFEHSVSPQSSHHWFLIFGLHQLQAPTGMFACLSISYYQPYFNVDTSDVQERLSATLLFWRAEPTFLSLIGDTPDLYGPFWVSLILFGSPQ